MLSLRRAIIVFFAFSCALPAFAEDDTLKKALSGKTLVNETAQLKLARNGRLSGKVGKDLKTEVKGAWTIRNGDFCRTLELPASQAGTACQKTVLNGDGTVTIDGLRGPATYRIK